MHPQSQPTPLKLLALRFIPFFLLSTGALALFSPTTMASSFGMPVEPDTFAAGFVQCFGGRNFVLGLISGTFLLRGEFKSVGTIASLLAVDGGIDGYVGWGTGFWMGVGPG